ncbi:hypothetical protein Q6344_09300 [Psychrobacter cibarius]|nr:hypothetical protein Q6344_09300 [Psychrobacter cibarius]
MKNEYDEMTSCNKCGGHNNYNAEALDGYTILEAFTICSVCKFKDYWAYGAFESRLEGFDNSKKYTTEQDDNNEINR